MKVGHYLLIPLIALTASCKKQVETAPHNDSDYIVGVTRVLGIRATDTVSTIFVRGRVETITALASDQDSKLKAELIAYQSLGGGKGKYTIRTINLTTCNSIVRWHWIGGILVDSIKPFDDALPQGDTVIYTVWGNATTGAITLNSQTTDGGTCGNSRTLQLNITTAILPTVFTDFTSKRKGDTMYVNFTDQYPQDTDKYLVMWSPDGNPAHETLIQTIKSDGVTKSHTFTFLAFLYEG